jgi:Ca2+-binding EF-hand superfamily protein
MSSGSKVSLNEEDIDTCQKAFSDLDEEGIGCIKAADLKLALERIGFIPSENDLYKMISEVLFNYKYFN